ncbi:MAG: hypothetical protein QM775_04290 [Pirellulales bacterium]
MSFPPGARLDLRDEQWTKTSESAHRWSGLLAESFRHCGPDGGRDFDRALEFAMHFANSFRIARQVFVGAVSDLGAGFARFSRQYFHFISAPRNLGRTENKFVGAFPQCFDFRN